MEFEEVVKKRKSTRNYINKKVSKKNLNKILNAARLAPSAKNRQPWRFLILNSKQKNDIVNMLLKLCNDKANKQTSVKGSVNMIKEADKLILVYRKINRNKEKNMKFKKADYLSIGAAIENLILECTNIGIDACWCCDTLYIDNGINDYLGIDEYEQMSSVVIGYSNDESSKKKKLKLSEIILKEGNENE